MMFYQTLPPISPRTQQLRTRMEKWDLHHDRPVLNLMARPEYANASFMLRRGMLVDALLEEMEIIIFPEDRLFGSFLGGIPQQITESYEERKAWADMSLAFPARNTVYGTNDYCYENRRLSENELHNPNMGRWSWGHSCYGLEVILKKGYLGLIEEAEAHLAAGEGDLAQREFWQSVSMACRGVIRHAERHADAIAALREAESDPIRQAELAEAEACVRRVPAHPVRSFYEAVQATWFSFMCHYLFNGTDIGRLDQYLYPYYEQDIQSGALTAEKAQELMDMLWLKMYEMQLLVPDNRGIHPSIMLAGVNADGKDITNPVTYMALTATRHIGSPNPKVSLRINEQTPEDIFHLAHEMLSSGLNMPDFYHEKAVLSAYERIGVPYADAVCFAQSVCEEVSLAGISEECTNEGPHIDLHDLVMRAMRRCSTDGADFETLLARVEEEIQIKVASEVEFHHQQTAKLAHYLPQPLHSATIAGCLDSGKDIYAGGAKYNNTGSVFSGAATAANSLYAIRRLVYDEKRLTIPQFLAILDADYQGYESLRAEILTKFPKYGNDVDDVDQYAVRMFRVFANELEKYRNSRGGVFKIGAWASEYRSNYPATPDGRKRWDSFAVNVSPTPGSDAKGATAVICSAAKLGICRCTAGGMVDVTLPPSALQGENGVQVLRQLIEVYCRMGGSAIQFNFIDRALLEKAVADPLQYRSLMVRVWGYNAYFVTLSPSMQKHLMDRAMR